MNLGLGDKSISVLLFWVFKWWISCAVAQQWHFYHIGMQLRGGADGTGKRKEELAQASTCRQLSRYRRANTLWLPEIAIEQNPPVLLECVHVHSGVSVNMFTAWFCLYLLKRRRGNGNRARVNEKSKQRECEISSAALQQHSGHTLCFIANYLFWN